MWWLSGTRKHNQSAWISIIQHWNEKSLGKIFLKIPNVVSIGDCEDINFSSSW